MMRVLVTGATGFMGRAVCESLQGRAWIRATSRTVDARGPWDESVRADLSLAVDDALLRGVDAILHCAGTAHAHLVALDDDAPFQAGNVTATRVLCEAARAAGVARFVLASSVSVLGDGGPRPVAEDAPPAPGSAYARSKLLAERIVQAAVAEPVVLRFPLVYGPGLPGNLARMIRAVEQHRFPPLPAVANRRSMIHVHDAARAMVMAAHDARAAGATFTVTDGRAYATREIHAWILAALGRRAPRVAPPALLYALAGRAGDIIGKVTATRAPFDSASLTKLLGSAEYTAERFRALGFAPEWDLERAMPAIVGARSRASDST